MADANSTRFSIVTESTFGVTPTPTMKILTTTGPELSPANQTVESASIRGNRNPPGAKLVGPSSGGRVPFELRYDQTGAQFDMLVASMQAGTPDAADGQVASVAASGQVLSAAGIGTGIEIGDVVRILDNSDDALVGFYRVVAVAGDVSNITVEGGLANGTYKVDRGTRIKNGATFKSFTMAEANYKPGGSSFALFEVFTGQVVDGFEMAVQDKTITTCAFQVVGRGSGGITEDTDPLAGATYAAAPTTEVLDATNNVPVVRVGATDTLVQSVNLSWQNGSAARSNVGQSLASSIRSGTFRVSGSFTAYYSDSTEYNKALAGTLSSLLVVQRDSAGNALAFSIPSIRYGNPTRTGKSQDSDIIVNLPWTAETDAVEDIGVRVILFNATPGS